MKIMSVIGARPQFVKAAAFRRTCTLNGVSEILVHSGQHYDQNMSLGIFRELGVAPPDYVFNLQHRTHGALTGEIMIKLEELILSNRPNVINVYGDTNTTLAAALVAAKLNIPISHIEAGLRSFNRLMPEEVNRVLTDHISEYLFCPTKLSVDQLAREGITDNVYHVGDIMYDCVKIFSEFFQFPKISLKSKKPLALLTLHRAENVNQPENLKKIIQYIEQFQDQYEIVFPIHPNTANRVKDFALKLDFCNVVSPLSYLETQGLLKNCELVLTDSGGLQKEAYFHRVDCITLRSETEWPETIRSGWNRLWFNERKYDLEKNEILDYGNGNTSKSIIEILLSN